MNRTIKIVLIFIVIILLVFVLRKTNEHIDESNIFTILEQKQNELNNKITKQIDYEKELVDLVKQKSILQTNLQTNPTQSTNTVNKINSLDKQINKKISNIITEAHNIPLQSGLLKIQQEQLQIEKGLYTNLMNLKSSSNKTTQQTPSYSIGNFVNGSFNMSKELDVKCLDKTNQVHPITLNDPLLTITSDNLSSQNNFTINNIPFNITTTEKSGNVNNVVGILGNQISINGSDRSTIVIGDRMLNYDKLKFLDDMYNKGR